MIKPISSQETFALRHPVLRPNRPLESCVFDGDDHPTTQHYGFFVEGKLVGVVSLFVNQPPFDTELLGYQLRGMAVLDEFQHQQIGKKLLQYLETLLHNKSVIIWCNARKSAELFYEKLGYQSRGPYFDIPLIGQHAVMFKLS